MALGGKHTAPQAAARGAVGKMLGDRFAVLENMAVTIDDFQLLCHRILLWQSLFASRRFGAFIKARVKHPGRGSRRALKKCESVHQALQNLQLASGYENCQLDRPACVRARKAVGPTLINKFARWPK